MLEQAPVHYRTARRIRNRTLGLVAADLTFSVRRLDATRIVRIQLKADQAKQGQ